MTIIHTWLILLHFQIINFATASSVLKLKSCIDPSDRIGSNYRGTVSTTKSGRTCIDWNLQYLNFLGTRTLTSERREIKKYLERIEGSLVASSNYCRNPDSSDTGPWCYVQGYRDSSTGRRKNWEACDIQVCKGRDPKSFSDYNHSNLHPPPL